MNKEQKVWVRILPVEELPEGWRKEYDSGFIYGINQELYQSKAGQVYEASIDDCIYSALIGCMFFPKGTYEIIKKPFNSLLKTERR